MPWGIRIQRDEDITAAPRENRPRTVFLRAARKVNEDRAEIAGRSTRKRETLLRHFTEMLGGSLPFFFIRFFRSVNSPSLSLSLLFFPYLSWLPCFSGPSSNVSFWCSISDLVRDLKFSRVSPYDLYMAVQDTRYERAAQVVMKSANAGKYKT